MSKQIEIMKLLPSLDYENCDMSLDHVEYHKAEDIDGEKFGDVSDNLYCFFKAV